MSDLPGCWATLPSSTKAFATGSDVLLAQELGSLRMAQEEIVPNKKKPPPLVCGEWNKPLSFCDLLEFPQKKHPLA